MKPLPKRRIFPQLTQTVNKWGDIKIFRHPTSIAWAYMKKISGLLSFSYFEFYQILTLPKALLLFGFLISVFTAKSQLSCSFTADTTHGCSPLQVRFTDLSSGGGTIIYRNWDFGNGGFSVGNNASPSRLYTTPGVYTVKLTVSDGTDTATTTYTNYIQVFRNPVARMFIYPISFCKPATFAFADSSQLGDAPILSRSWDFGDLTPTSSQTHPSHSYPFEGNYSITLTVTDTHGCRSSLQKINAVRVIYPQAAFSVNKTYDCRTPSTFQFTFSGKGRAPLSYKWHFGDGDSASLQNPAHTYTSIGNFSVWLIVTDSAGCKDTLLRTQFIRIAPLVADFDGPDTLCRLSPDTFKNTSTGGNSFYWSFGDGDTSVLQNPLKSYAQSGYYSVKLRVSASAQCRDSIIKNVYVEVLRAGYYVTYDSVCKPHFVTYRDTSAGNVANRIYRFGNGEFGGHPSNWVASPKKDTTLMFAKGNCFPRIVPDTLIVISQFGCKDTTWHNTRTQILGDRIGVIFRQSDRCVPAVVDSFNYNHCLRFSPVSWLWEFTDSTTTDTVYASYPNRTDTFHIWGQRTGRLWITDSMGCKHTAPFSYRVGAKPQADFMPDKDTLCLTDTLFLRNLSTDSSLALTYEWNFGEGVPNPPVVSRHTQNVYKFCGSKTVRLYTSHFECRDTMQKTVYVSGPMGSVSLNNNCLNPMQFSLQGFPACGYNRFYWQFGDTSALDSSSLSPIHTYPQAGIYNGFLTLVNDTTGCVYSAPFKAEPYVILAVIDTAHLTPGLCAPVRISVSGMSSKGVHANKFYWNFGNGQTAAFVSSSPSQTYPALGSYTIRLIIEDRYGCRDTAYHPVSVYGPVVQFNMPAPVCHGDSFVIVPQIQSPIGVPDMKWYLDTVFQHSSPQYPFYHEVDTTGRPYSAVYYDTLELKFWVRDSAGCTDSVINQFLVGRVFTRPLLTDSSLCSGDTIEVNDLNAPTPNFTYRWILGNGDSLQTHRGKALYVIRGDTQLTYRATEPFGCMADDTLQINIEGIDSVSFSASVTDTNCYPATIYFSDQSTGDSVQFRYWTFGDGSAPVPTLLKDSLARIFSAPGKFDISLTVETRNGCRDSLRKPLYINIRGPFAQFSISDDSLCIHEPLDFYLDTANEDAQSIIWDFADGRVDSLPTDTLLRRHSYGMAGRFLCIFVVTDSSGKCRRFEQMPVVVEEVIAGFDITSDSAGCTPYTFQLANRSQFADYQKYTPDEGNSQIRANPSFEFIAPGKHRIRQDVLNTRNGCRDSAFREVLIYPLPMVKASTDTMICKGDSAVLVAGGAHTYSWTPASYLRNASQNPTYAAPPADMKYTVLGTDTHGCKNTDTLKIWVQPPPEIFIQTDTAIIIGEWARLFAKGLHVYRWKWRPANLVACDTCANTLAQVKERTQILLIATDSLGCFTDSASFWVDVAEKYSVDVPEVFTPNGDGINDLIFPAGWGIEDFLEFKVYNRWGELIFEGGGNQWGWDGTYKGTPQNPDTYLYVVRVKGYNAEEQLRQGYFTLLR
jgi:gliding motility-associated-like protein